MWGHETADDVGAITFDHNLARPLTADHVDGCSIAAATTLRRAPRRNAGTPGALLSRSACREDRSGSSPAGTGTAVTFDAS
ncbi:MAG: hypothetical protein ACLPVY_08550 [Acidimicrobiia bacterium]